MATPKRSNYNKVYLRERQSVPGIQKNLYTNTSAYYILFVRTYDGASSEVYVFYIIKFRLSHAKGYIA